MEENCFACTKCDKVFLTQENLSKHEQETHRKKEQDHLEDQSFEFIMGNGGKIDYRKSVEQFKLNVVLLDINADRRYNQDCSVCGDNVSISHLKEHNENCVSNSNQGQAKVRKIDNSSRLKVKFLPYKCDLCDERFHTRKGRNIHQQDHKNKNIAPKSKKIRGGRPRGRPLQRKILKTKKITGGTTNTTTVVSKDFDMSSISIIDNRQLRVVVFDIAKSLQTIVDQDGTTHVQVDPNFPDLF